MANPVDKNHVNQSQQLIDQSTSTQVSRVAFRTGAVLSNSTQALGMKAVGNCVFGVTQARKEMDELVFEDMRNNRTQPYGSPEALRKKAEDALDRLQKDPTRLKENPTRLRETCDAYHKYRLEHKLYDRTDKLIPSSSAHRLIVQITRMPAAQ